jgi:fatty acid desaturase
VQDGWRLNGKIGCFRILNPEHRRQLFWRARLILLGHVLFAGIACYFHLWILLVLVTFAPFYATWLQVLVGFPQHTGLSPNVSDFRLCCRSIQLNPFFGFLYWQMQHHIEHHMYAAVPFHKLHELRKVIESDLPPAPRGLWATWKELLPVLRRQKTDPNYVFRAKLPAPMVP